jgi:hypothetical protein
VTVSHVFPLRTSNDVILDTSNVKRLSLEKNLIHDTPPVLDNQAVWNGSGNETMYFEKRLGRWSVRLLRLLPAERRDRLRLSSDRFAGQESLSTSYWTHVSNPIVLWSHSPGLRHFEESPTI